MISAVSPGTGGTSRPSPQGYRAILREAGGHAPVVLYGRTPAELAESIRMAQVPS